MQTVFLPWSFSIKKVTFIIAVISAVDHDLGCGHFSMVLILKTNLKGLRGSTLACWV